jgi:hypothetical protein
VGVEERWFPSLVVVCLGPLHLSPSFFYRMIWLLWRKVFLRILYLYILVSNFSLSSVALGLLIQIGIDTGSWAFNHPREGIEERFQRQTGYASVLVSLIKMVWFGTDQHCQVRRIILIIFERLLLKGVSDWT